MRPEAEGAIGDLLMVSYPPRRALSLRLDGDPYRAVAPACVLSVRYFGAINESAARVSYESLMIAA